MRYGLWIWPVATLLIVTSCSSTEWVHREKPKSQLNNEYTSCEREVFNDYNANPTGQFTPYVQAQRIDACLKQRGWVQREVK
jgi:hypothetical protein